MKIEQLYTGCLSEAAYYIESNGVAAIIDPIRETAPYIAKAKSDGATIKYIFETHFHADFVSGHLELAQKTGAKIVYGPGAKCDFDYYSAKDGEEFTIGDLRLKVIHTPGHTPESSTYLLSNSSGKPYCIFTGDTLFIGDVGRPDLAIKSNVTQEDLAGMLYDSLHHKILPLPDDVIVYPAHGAGSSCGKNLSKETFDTLGHQKQVNYALQPIAKEEFVKELVHGLLPPPQYFSKNAMLNKRGAGSLDSVYTHGLKKLNPNEFETAAINNEALVLDTRDPQVFCKAFIPGSINIGLDGQFAPWVGALIADLNQPILIVCEEGKEEETVRRLARVGYDNTLGYLDGGITGWKSASKPLDSITSISTGEFESRYNKDLSIIDVRKPVEYEGGHIVNAESKPLDFINEWTNSVERNETQYIHCAGGYRSMIAASILKSRGYNNLVEVAGGYTAISRTSIPQEVETEVTK